MAKLATEIKDVTPPAQTEEKKAIALATNRGVPAYLTEEINKDAGKGVSKAQEDNLVPLVYVLQTNSPQVNKKSPKYVEGAEAGDIWLRNAPNPIVKGDEGFSFQPCFFFKDWVEWVPRDDGGGYVGRHTTRPVEAVEVTDPKNPKRANWMLPNGNEVKETRSHVGFVITDHGSMPFIIPLTSTGHSVSRQLMFLMNSKTTEKGEPEASWAHTYRFKTTMRSNNDGDWFVLNSTDEDYVQSLDQYRKGRQLYEQFASGAKQAEAPIVDTDAVAPSSDEDVI